MAKEAVQGGGSSEGVVVSRSERADREASRATVRQLAEVLGVAGQLAPRCLAQDRVLAAILAACRTFRALSSVSLYNRAINTKGLCR